jgi:hypothetical protein
LFDETVDEVIREAINLYQHKSLCLSDTLGCAS